MKLTSREREIIEVLYKEPLISQEELALRFGISRSSAAVHISNLMKKGIILGKGYVFNKKASIVVIGELLLKIVVRQNQGQSRIDTEYGGFSAEVCQALASFGLNTKLMTVLGNDELGTKMLSELKNHEVDVSNVVKDSNLRTSRKIYLDKNLQFAENIPEEAFAKAIEAREWVVLNCDWLLVEEQYQEMICKKVNSKDEKSPALCACRFIHDQVPEFLSQYGLVVLGTDNFQNFNRISQAGQRLVQEGTQNCIITDGSFILLQSSEQADIDFSLPPNQSFDSQADLHLFLAGLVYGMSSGYPIRQALRIAIANACNQEIDNRSIR